MSYRDEVGAALEGEVLHTTAKSYLVELTLGGEYWIPKSQIVSMTPTTDGKYMFEVTAWWSKKNDF